MLGARNGEVPALAAEIGTATIGGGHVADLGPQLAPRDGDVGADQGGAVLGGTGPAEAVVAPEGELGDPHRQRARAAPRAMARRASSSASRVAMAWRLST